MTLTFRQSLAIVFAALALVVVMAFVMHDTKQSAKQEQVTFCTILFDRSENASDSLSVILQMRSCLTTIPTTPEDTAQAVAGDSTQ